jgi:hypothetical protein
MSRRGSTPVEQCSWNSACHYAALVTVRSGLSLCGQACHCAAWLVTVRPAGGALWGSRTWHLPLTSGDRPPQTFRHDRRRVTAAQQHHPADRPADASRPSPRPRRGPYPGGEGHRAAQPAAARAGSEPDLAGHRRACEITAWTQLLAPAEHPARRWEPNVSGCGSSPCPPGGPSRPPPRPASTRSDVLADLVTDGITRLRALAVPG